MQHFALTQRLHTSAQTVRHNPITENTTPKRENNSPVSLGRLVMDATWPTLVFFFFCLLFLSLTYSSAARLFRSFTWLSFELLSLRPSGVFLRIESHRLCRQPRANIRNELKCKAKSREIPMGFLSILYFYFVFVLFFKYPVCWLILV